MLPLPEFSLERPETSDAACRLLAEHERARIIAGGTDLLPSMKYGLFDPPTLIQLGRAGLGELHLADDQLSIGATATLREVARNPVVQQRYPALAAACRTVATPTLQGMATLGGNLMLDTRCVYYNQSTFWRDSLGGCLKCEVKGETICHVAPKGSGCYAAHSADTVPVLMLMDARVELASVRGTRQLPLTELYGDDGRTWIQKERDELLTRVILPPPSGDIVHRKLRARGAIDYPLLLTAVKRTPKGGRVVLSALGPRPVEIEDVSGPIAQGDFEEAARIAWKQAFPLATHVWSSTWRKKMVRVEVRRALESLA